jgi:uncharacterized protein (TIGR03083 family)
VEHVDPLSLSTSYPHLSLDGAIRECTRTSKRFVSVPFGTSDRIVTSVFDDRSEMMPEPYDAGWMSGDKYDRLRAQEFETFRVAASLDLSAHVPTCPEWDMTALCDHLARVYQARTYTIEHSKRATSDDFAPLASGEDPIEFVTSWSDALNRSLTGRDDSDPTITFLPEANTMHFWRRRMALETFVHRTDAEIAVGVVSEMDDELSADGVAELLWFGSSDPDIHHADGIDDPTVVALSDGRHQWRVTLNQSALLLGDTGAALDATVHGSAAALLLVLSGRDIAAIGADRFGVEMPIIEGNPAAFERLLAHLGQF